VTLTPVSATEAAVTDHLRCFAACDLDGILAGYTDDAALHTAAGTARGHDALRQFFTVAFSEFGKPSTTFEMKHQIFDGEVGFVVWSAETEDNIYDLGTDTFVVRDGKIATQTFAAKITPKH
jgi:ketosteroid isomerase-like protein